MKTLGFENYLDDCNESLKEFQSYMKDRKALKKRRNGQRIENMGIPEEELYRQQQELFAEVIVFRIEHFFKFVTKILLP